MTSTLVAPARPLSPARTRLALLSLALGAFAVGATEFVVMGLLPEVTAGLLPALDAVDHEAALARAGWLISAYALGVVVGAPTIAALSARLPRKHLVIGLLAWMVVATVASAVLPSFGLVLVARFVAGLPHGAYFGVASLIGGTLLGGSRGKGAAFVLAGLAISNVVGVPSITWIGQLVGWRTAYGIVAAIFAATCVLVAALVPFQPGDPGATMRRELSALRRPQMWLTIAMASIAFGGFFAVYSYVADIVRDVAQRDAAFVPIALVCVGVGMTIGNFVGGWAADRHVMRTIYVGFGVFAFAFLGLGVAASSWPALLFFLALLGAAASGISPTIMTRLLDVAGDSQTLAAAINHACFNLGNSLGAVLGGAVIAAGFGLVAPAWVGLLLLVPGLALALISRRMERSDAGLR